ncbi:MAG: hypothetical protein DCC67_17580 [Planctomycetota bacterium]|nr:MAG: hypothetical protein DCC67_17580 [Planctomycetota bacterium]
MSQRAVPGVCLDSLFDPAARTGASGAVVSGCTADWRQVSPGDAFVAVLEDDSDGHDFADEAVRRGAVAVIAERPLPIFDAPVYYVDDTRIALGELCHALVESPSRRLAVIGVVGTQGKSTTIALLESIFAAAGRHVGVLSTLKSYDGMTRSEGQQGPLSPPRLARRLARMEQAGCTHVLLELSTESLSQHRLAGVELDAVCVTTVDSARLELYHSAHNYRQASRRALTYLSPGGMTVINADDPVSSRWLSELEGPALTYGLGDQAQVTADVIEQNAGETVFVLVAGHDSVAVRTAIAGDAHVSNCLAAATLALAYGVELTAIAAGIEAIQKLPARMERVDCGQDFALFVDAADTALGLKSTLCTARKLASGRVICVLGDSLPPSPAEATAIRSVVTKLADLTIISDAVVAADAAWLPKTQRTGALQVAANRGEAFAWAVAAAQPGDVVVIAGSRAPTPFAFGSVETSDADAVRELLYACAGPALRLAG